jgi:hypothetical protein
MTSCGMLRRVVVRIDVSEELIASITRVTRIGKPLILRVLLRCLANAVPRSLTIFTLMM